MSNIKFGTDGWRAIMAEDFTFANVKLVAQAIANFLSRHALRENGVVIGYDNRFLSERFAAEVAKVMAGNGIKALPVNRATPTPVTAYAIITHKAAGAVMITASHNPPEYNGIKFIPEYAGPALPEITDQIEAELHKMMNGAAVKEISLKDAADQGLYREIDPMPQYKEHIRHLVDFPAIRAAKLKLIVDPMYGAGYDYLDEILTSEGCDVTAIHNYRDPLFGGSMPEPSAQVLTELREWVLTEKADLGLALDGDADRFGIIDSNGEYITPNKVLYILYYYLITMRQYYGKAARSVATTHMIDRVAAKFGFRAEETPVGFKYIGEAMMKKNVILGGEESGGLSIKGHIPEKDGILAALLMAEVRAKLEMSLTDLVVHISREFGYMESERLDIHVDPAEKDRILNDLANYHPKIFNGQDVRDRYDMGGTKVIMDDGAWFLVRVSGTEPLFRIYVEANSLDQLKAIQQEVRTVLKM